MPRHAQAPRRSHRSRARASSMDVVFVSSRQRRRFRPTARRCPGWRCCLPNTRKVNWIQSRVLRAATFKGQHSAFDKDKHTPSTLARTGPRRASLTHLSLLGLVVSRRDCCHLGHLGHAGSAGTRVLCLCECFLGWSAGSARVGRDHLTRAPPRISHTHSLSHTHTTHRNTSAATPSTLQNRPICASRRREISHPNRWRR